jgi:hypothetical protein
MTLQGVISVMIRRVLHCRSGMTKCVVHAGCYEESDSIRIQYRNTAWNNRPSTFLGHLPEHESKSADHVARFEGAFRPSSRIAGDDSRSSMTSLEKYSGIVLANSIFVADLSHTFANADHMKRTHYHVPVSAIARPDARPGRRTTRTSVSGALSEPTPPARDVRTRYHCKLAHGNK